MGTDRNFYLLLCRSRTRLCGNIFTEKSKFMWICVNMIFCLEPFCRKFSANIRDIEDFEVRGGGIKLVTVLSLLSPTLIPKRCPWKKYTDASKRVFIVMDRKNAIYLTKATENLVQLYIELMLKDFAGKEHALLISNHKSDIDWLVGWVLAQVHIFTFKLGFLFQGHPFILFTWNFAFGSHTRTVRDCWSQLWTKAGPSVLKAQPKILHDSRVGLP